MFLRLRHNLRIIIFIIFVYSFKSFDRFIWPSNEHHSKTEEFGHSRKFLFDSSVVSRLHHTQPLATIDLLSVAVTLSFPECPATGFINDVAFWAWLLSPHVMHLRFLSVPWISNLFLFIAEYYSTVYPFPDFLCLWIGPLWTFTDSFLCEHTLSFR